MDDIGILSTIEGFRDNVTIVVFSIESQKVIRDQEERAPRVFFQVRSGAG